MKAYFIRHGITDWNLQNRGQGREDIELNEGGLKQAEYCGNALSNMQIDCVVTSPLKRAVRTAEEIYKHHSEAVFEKDEAFIERDLGKYSGLTADERNKLIEQGVPSNAEPRPDVAKRTVEGLMKLQKRYPDGNVVIVTHGGVITALLEYLEYAKIYTVFLDNVHVTEVEVTGDKCQVLRCNLAPEEV